MELLFFGHSFFGGGGGGDVVVGSVVVVDGERGRGTWAEGEELEGFVVFADFFG